MAEQRHVSIPKPFASGDAGEWFKRFEIRCKANAWDETVKVLKLPTLLEGEALVTWMELSEDEQGDYGAAKQKMIERQALCRWTDFSSADFDREKHYRCTFTNSNGYWTKRCRHVSMQLHALRYCYTNLWKDYQRLFQGS